MLAFVLIQHIDKTSYMSIYVLKITESVRRSKNCNKVYFAKHECTCSNLLTLVSLLFFWEGQAKCYGCFGSDAASCLENQRFEPCGPKSLGLSHCGSAVGKYRDSSGNVRDVFYRGCIDCLGNVRMTLYLE